MSSKRGSMAPFVLALLGACAAPQGIRPTLPATPGKVSTRGAEAILRSFAEAWRGEEEMALEAPMVLGIWVDGQGHTVRLSNEGATYTAGAPETFGWGFDTDLETLRRLDAETWNALTALGQARPSDPIPLRPRLPDGFARQDEVRSFFIPLTLRFWNRNWPETIPFGDGATRPVQGGDVSVLVYADGLRSAWYQVRPGAHINEKPEDQVNDFDTAIVVTRGEFTGVFDGVERVLRGGETVLVPGGMRHELYATDSQYGEFIMLMYGEGA